jgi:hypothetical protein
MIDPGTGLTILGTAVGGAKVVEKILGPTAEYIGQQIREWTEKKVKNTANIFKNAERKLGDKINLEGNVSPKVLKGILEDGAWCEEDLQVEYFGGVLASSRSGISRDDRGAYYTDLISRLSTYQLRTHYLFYHSIKSHFSGQDINVNDGNTWRDLELFFPYETYFYAMDFSKEEYENWGNLLSHSLWGLNKEDLISEFSFGNQDFIKKKFSLADIDGVLMSPTKIGVELFMWAYGLGQNNPNDFFKESVTFKNELALKIGYSISTKKAKEEELLKKEEEKKKAT